MNRRLTKQDLEWRAQDDARVLIEDKKRLNMALSKVKDIASDAEKSFKTAKKIVNKKKEK